MINSDFEENIFNLIDEDGSLNYGQAYIVKPKTNEKKLPLLVALHGSGREALSYRDIPFYAKQRDIAIESGYIFACISNSSHTYGTDKGYENVLKLYEYIKKNYKIYKDIALWSSSAGGLMMHRFFREYRDNIKLLLGTFPLFNPLTTLKLGSLLKAYGACNEEEFINIIKDKSPDRYPLDIYRDTRIVIAHGVDDTAVDISQSEELLKQVKTYGGDMELIKTAGGHSVENFALYETESFHKALKDMKMEFIRAENADKLIVDD